MNQTMRTLFVLLSLLGGCSSTDYDGRAVDTVEPSQSGTTVRTAQAVGVLDVFNAIIFGGAVSTGSVPAVILELLDNYDSRGHYSLPNHYSTQSELMDELNAQDSKYAWLIDRSFLVGYPRNNSLLDTPLPESLALSDVEICVAVEKLITTARPLGRGRSGCLMRRPPQYLSEAQANRIKAARLTLNVEKGTSVRSALIALLNGLPSSIGVLVYTPAPGLRPVISLIW